MTSFFSIARISATLIEIIFCLSGNRGKKEEFLYYLLSSEQGRLMRKMRGKVNLMNANKVTLLHEH